MAFIQMYTVHVSKVYLINERINRVVNLVQKVQEILKYL